MHNEIFKPLNKITFMMRNYLSIKINNLRTKEHCFIASLKNLIHSL